MSKRPPTQDIWSQIETRKAPHRVILLGASNLKRSLHHAVATARVRLPGQLSFHVVMGYGRSYGIEAGWLHKKFLGIFQCELWEELQREETRPTFAFVTDVGNDLAYEIPVAEVLDWVAICLDRLRECEARVVVTALPLAPLRQISRLRFGLFRTLLFPRCRLTQSELLKRAERLDAGLRELAESQKIPIFSAPNAWYGLDPIHLRRPFMKAWWESVFDLVEKCESTFASDSDTWLLKAYLRCLHPPALSSSSADHAVRVQHITLHNGTSITLY